MKINLIYRISSHNQIIEVDEASTSLEKISKKVILFEKSLPDMVSLGKLLRKKSVGTAIILEELKKESINIFDTISIDDSHLLVHEVGEIQGVKMIICQPERFITFNLEKKLKLIPKVFKIEVITINDRAYRGIAEDLCSPKVIDLIKKYFGNLNKKIEINNVVLPNSKPELLEFVLKARNNKCDALFTIGGTGIGKKDITIETVSELVAKKVPGIIEIIRIKYGHENPQILLNRFIAGAMNETLVYTLPDNIDIVEIYLKEILHTFDNMIDMLYGVNK